MLPVGLGSSAVTYDLLQYAMTRMSLFNLENLDVMSSGTCRHARCTFLISKLSVGVLTSVWASWMAAG